MAFIWRAVKEVFWLGIAVAIVAGGWFGFQYLAANRTIVEAAPIEETVPTVDVAVATALEGGIPIRADGFIAAAQLLDMAAETGGRIVELHPAIDARGPFAEGDVLFRLDDRNARASVAQIEANIESTRAQLDLTRTQLERAEALRQRGVIAQDQLDQTVAREQELSALLTSQQANLLSAQVALDSTIVRAPFDGRVLAKNAELGAVIAQGTPVAQIYSSDQLEVTVDIREAEAALLTDLFGTPEASAHVETSFAGERYRWDASIARVERQIDSETRTIRLSLALDDPDAGRPVSAEGDANEIPALINAFVSVEIMADAPVDAVVVPVTAVRDNREVWLYGEGQLEIVPIRVLQRSSGLAYVVGAGVDTESQLIVSPLSSVSDGMILEASQPARPSALEES
ncbi:MAG: efflux RND transporter periplasmic adaptor subunit [Devosiaceae bacterium]|nr:efflux RND transporter periplasmic adaptor subunit [Devosiaceae bacterium MH13]